MTRRKLAQMSDVATWVGDTCPVLTESQVQVSQPPGRYLVLTATTAAVFGITGTPAFVDVYRGNGWDVQVVTPVVAGPQRRRHKAMASTEWSAVIKM